MALAMVVGYFIFGAMVGLYAILPAVYPTEVRNTGAGLAIGVGRCGAIVSPFLAGVMLEGGWKPSSAYLAFATPLLVAAVATVVLGRLHAVRST
jgi:MFS family permease